MNDNLLAAVVGVATMTLVFACQYQTSSTSSIEATIEAGVQRTVRAQMSLLAHGLALPFINKE